MSLDNNKTYCNIPFTTDTHHGDFYTYGTITDLISNCEVNKEDMSKCRTVGILHSHHGKFFVYDMNASGVQRENKIQISMAYLKSPPLSTVMPYPVQVFGTLQWKNRPVIFAKILQVLNVPMALRIRDVMSVIVASHLATTPKDLLQEIPT